MSDPYANVGLKNDSPVSQETLKGLSELNNALAANPKSHTPVPGANSEPEPLKKDTKEQNEYGTFYSYTMFDNPSVRAKIEQRCTELDMMDLIYDSSAKQVVPIIEKKLVVRFRSLTGKDSSFIETQSSKLDMPQWAVRNWIGYATIVLSLVSVNDNEYPSIRTSDGEIDESRFNDKYNRVMDMSEHVLELILVNYGWFRERVNTLLHDELMLIKN